MATKSPRNRLLNRSSKSQENRKCKRVFIVIFYSSSILSHTKMHCGKCVTVVDGHTRCLVACCMSRTCYRFTHRNLFQITNLGRWCPQRSTRQEAKYFSLYDHDGYRNAFPRITNFCFVVSQISIFCFVLSFRKLP